MKLAAVLLLAFSAISFADDQPKPEEKKRLESVTWDLNSHHLVWVVQKGSEVDGKFVAESKDRYEISPDDAVMAVADEKRGFTEDEARSLHKLLDTLSLYCAESVVWWDQGQGVPLDENEKPVSPHKHKDGSDGGGQKVAHPAPQAPLVRDGDLVAHRGVR